MSVVYLYGFTPAATTLPDRGLLGVGDVEVELVELGEFSAVVGRLDAPGFAGDALEQNSGDVEWMAEQGLRHEQVVAWFVDHASILPSRLLTLFSGVDALRDRVEEDRSTIQSRLDRFGPLDEWDLRVSYESDRVMEHIAEISGEVEELDRQISEASPGKRFLLEKKRKDLARSESRTAAARLARELLASLRPLAEEVVTVDPPGDAPPATLTAALLVRRDRRDRVRSVVAAEGARVESLGLNVRLTGPWAPYRFLAHE